MPTVLVIDPAKKTRTRVLRALTDTDHRVFMAEGPNAYDSMIRSLQPDIILLNRRSADFDAISLFMELKERFPDKPALLYAMESSTAEESLQHAVDMALYEKRKLFGRSRHLPA